MNTLYTGTIKYSIYAQKCSNDKVYIFVDLDGIVDDNVKIIFTGNNEEVYKFLIETHKNMYLIKV